MYSKDKLIKEADKDPSYIVKKKIEAEQKAYGDMIYSVLRHDFEDQLARWFQEVEIRPVPIDYQDFSRAEDPPRASCKALFEAEGYRFSASARQEYVQNLKKKRLERKPISVSISIYFEKWGGWEPANNRIALGHAFRKERDYVPKPHEDW